MPKIENDVSVSQLMIRVASWSSWSSLWVERDKRTRSLFQSADILQFQRGRFLTLSIRPAESGDVHWSGADHN
eukprot:scaffold935_cov248-Pinguiococcus_pyrenoidosus.AAC.2